MSGGVSLRQLADYIFVLAPRERIGVVLRRNSYECPEDDPDSVLALCLDQGAEYAIRELLERENEIIDLCKVLNIEVKDYEDRSVMIGKINNLYFESRKPRGIRRILRFVDDYYKNTSDFELLKHFARECFLVIESLMRDFYGAYIYCFLRRYLNREETERVENVVNHRPVNTRNVVDQIIRYEKKIRNGEFPDFIDEIQKKNGQNSIFDGIKGEDIDIFPEILNIRNEYLSHENIHPESLIYDKVVLFFKYVECLFSQIISPPLSIIPVKHFVDKMGVHCIEFLDEDDQTRKIFLYEIPADFRPNQQAYCFHPTKKHPMIDPTIIYQRDLIFRR